MRVRAFVGQYGGTMGGAGTLWSAPNIIHFGSPVVDEDSIETWASYPPEEENQQ